MSPRSRRRPTSAPGARRRARELALAGLYKAHLLGLSVADAIEVLPDCLALSLEDWPAEDRESPELREEALAYATRIVAGVFGSQDAIDQAIAALSTDWPLDRLAAVDRAILRIAMWELNEATAAPAVVINEAVELAREYGTAESPKFVNGVLGACVRERERTAKEPTTGAESPEGHLGSAGDTPAET